MPFRRRATGEAPPAFSSPAAPPRHGSVQQAHFRIAAIERDTIRLHGHEYRALVECVGVAVHTLPPNEQEATLAGYASFLNALPFPTQLQVRIQRRSLEPHIRAVRQAAQGFEGRRDTGALSRVAEGYLRYLTGLHDQALLRGGAGGPSRGAGRAARAGAGARAPAVLAHLALAAGRG